MRCSIKASYKEGPSINSVHLLAARIFLGHMDSLGGGIGNWSAFRWCHVSFNCLLRQREVSARMGHFNVTRLKYKGHGIVREA